MRSLSYAHGFLCPCNNFLVSHIALYCIISEILVEVSQSLSAALARGQIPLTRQDTEECCVSNWENNSADEKVHLER